MHGRVKVRTSAEEKIRKDKEKQQKLTIYKDAMQKVFTKRKQGELDRRLLCLTDKVLSSNPDIYTLWNIRREILKLFRENEDFQEEISELYNSELYLTEYCLKVNPKSYCAWHQRQWTLLERSDPDWQKELSLCNTYLKLDERNFHTWDYRRFVVNQCKPSLIHEFNFTTEKLHDNFSNYSAWHYRSKLLVELYPDLEGGRPIQDNHHKHELKMVQNAAFTDPDDTSAWFYQRWLLGAVKTVTRMVVCTVAPRKTSVAFSKYVDYNFIRANTKLIIDDVEVNGEWYSSTGNKYDVLWCLKHDILISDTIDVKVKYNVDSEEEIIQCVKYKPNVYVGKGEACFRRKYSEAVITELKEQLDSCRQLLVLEPDSKWTLLTTTVFLHCIDPQLYHEEVIKKLQELKNIDTLRSGYYNDLISQWSIEQQLSQDYNENKSLEMKVMFNEKLTNLAHLQFYSHCESVDLSNQSLTARVLPSLVVLQHCKVLSLENNQIHTLKGFPDLKLDVLNLKRNVDLTLEEIEKFKETNNYKIIY